MATVLDLVGEVSKHEKDHNPLSVTVIGLGISSSEV